MIAAFRRVAAVFVFAVACASQAGCVTAAMWSRANESTFSYGGGVAGMLVRPDGSPEAAVVRYELSSHYRFAESRPRYLLVPLNADGSAAAPHGLVADGRTPVEVVTGLSDAQRDAVKSAQLQPDAYAGGSDAVLKSSRFRKLDWEVNAVATRPGEPVIRLREIYVPDPVHGGRLSRGLLFYEIVCGGDGPAAEPPPPSADEDRTGYVTALEERSRRHERAMTQPSPPRATVLVVATSTPRSPEEQSAAKTRAALLTPLTVPLDIVLIPLVPIYILLTIPFGGPC